MQLFSTSTFKNTYFLFFFTFTQVESFSANFTFKQVHPLLLYLYVLLKKTEYFLHCYCKHKSIVQISRTSRAAYFSVTHFFCINSMLFRKCVSSSPRFEFCVSYFGRSQRKRGGPGRGASVELCLQSHSSPARETAGRAPLNGSLCIWVISAGLRCLLIVSWVH